MGFSSLQQSKQLRERLRWWLVVFGGIVLLLVSAFGVRSEGFEPTFPAIAVVVLLAIGVWVDQMLLSRPIARDHASTRSALLELNQRLVIEANTDVLTGLYNRRGLAAFFQELASTQRFRHQSIAVLMIDLDGFKSFNDRYGHLIGDQILRQAADSLRQSLRCSDGIGRWGGDELCVVLPNTALSQAMLVAKKLCHHMARSPLETMEKGAIVRIELKASIGVAAVDSAQDVGLEALIAGADKALYQAKAAGGNRAVGNRLD